MVPAWIWITLTQKQNKIFFFWFTDFFLWKFFQFRFTHIHTSYRVGFGCFKYSLTVCLFYTAICFFRQIDYWTILFEFIIYFKVFCHNLFFGWSIWVADDDLVDMLALVFFFRFGIVEKIACLFGWLVVFIIVCVRCDCVRV